MNKMTRPFAQLGSRFNRLGRRTSRLRYGILPPRRTPGISVAGRPILRGLPSWPGPRVGVGVAAPGRGPRCGSKAAPRKQ